MIDEDRTLQLFGHTSKELTRQSRKVVIVCEGCGKYRVVTGYGNFDRLCRSCGKKDAMTDELREKIRRERVGRVVSVETRDKMSISHKRIAKYGADHHNWKGGKIPFRTYLYHQNAYKNWRTAVFKRDDYTCQMCNEQGGRLEAHHIRPVRDHKNDLLIYCVDNGITLCKKCHRSIRCHEDDYISTFDAMREMEMQDMMPHNP